MRGRFKNIREFNKLWEKGEFTTPICILIGGAAATGKSSLAKRLQHDISHINLIGTPLIRSMCGLFIAQRQNPYLGQHTFDLVECADVESEKKKLIERYKEQSNPIKKTVREFMRFIKSEKQNYIIEGSNILPNGIQEDADGVIVIEIYLCVEDKNTHKIMFSGPTHNRLLTKNRFINLRILNRFIYSDSINKGRKIFDVEQKYEEILDYIDKKIGEHL